MTKCKAKTKSGIPCPNRPGASGYCFTHDPSRGAERAKARKRGGASRLVAKVADTSTVKTPIRDIAGVLSILDVATVDTLALYNSGERTRALVGVAMAYLKAFEVGEMESRLAAIEQALKVKLNGKLEGAH
jgi:hypothetical protein